MTDERLAKRAEVVRAWQQSGKTGRAFAAEQGIGYSTLQWWAREVRQLEKSTCPSTVAMARVVRRNEGAATPRASAIATLIGDVRVMVDGDVDDTLLRRVLLAAREASA
jgi:hypothetical protein